MQNRYVFILIATLLVLDALVINCSIFLLQYFNLAKQSGIDFQFETLIIVNLTWFISSLFNKPYHHSNVQSIKSICLRGVKTFITQVALLILASLLFSNLHFLAENMVTILLIEFSALALIRLSIYLSETYYFNFDSYKKKIAIIGHNDISLKLEQYFLKNRLSYDFSGSYEDCSEANANNGETLSDLKNTIKFALENNLDEVYTTLFPENNKGVDELLAIAEQNCVRVKFATTIKNYQNQEETLLNNYKLSNFYDGIPILVARHEPLNLIWNRVIKRSFDIVFSLGVIVFILSWLFPIIIILILLESPGSPIFSQLRSGRNNEAFWCFKFRSMQINADSNNVQATKGDKRITKIGAFLRKTSLDEFPQFFNVLIGNMSIVGPRPHMLKHTEEYRQIIDQYMVRHYLKPGITGWAQVNGHRGETKEHKQMLARVEHDVWYMENWSLAKDIEIVYKTVANVARGEENAY
ncbi:MAG: exopolysaccharide biosynthesis polyprenyl glycosylphosphotransferase [Pedobacter sp.]|nr:MAG: exopolysaccharide biosynthesis polyprenyl glycosylphosphotransferase [Pedobacter sp.]